MGRRETHWLSTEDPVVLAEALVEEFSPDGRSALAGAAVDAAMNALPFDHAYTKEDVRKIAGRAAALALGLAPLPEPERRP